MILPVAPLPLSPVEDETTFEATPSREPSRSAVPRRYFSHLKSSIKNETAVLAFAQLAYMGVTLLVATVAGRWIRPEDMGVWRVLALVEVYANFAVFGIPSGFLRQFPIAKGAGNREVMASIGGALYGALAIQSVVGTALLIFLSTTSPALRGSSWLAAATAAYALYFMVARFKSAIEIVARADGQFQTLSRAYFWTALVRLISLVLIPLWGFPGFLLRWPLSLLAEWAIFHYSFRRRLAVALRLPDRHTLIELERDGMPHLVITSMAAFSDSLDRTWLSLHAHISSVGMYFLADSVKMFLASVLGSVALVQYNRCALAYGLKSLTNMRHSVSSAVRLLGVAYVGSAALLLLAIPIFVRMLMPRYAAGIPASLVILVGGFGIALASVGFLLTVTRRYIWWLCAAAGGLAAQWLCQRILTGRLPPETMVATAWSAGQVVNGVIMVSGVLVTLKTFTVEVAEGR